MTAGGEHPTGHQPALAARTEEFEAAVREVRDRDAWEALRVSWVGRKQGLLRTLLDDIKKVEPAERRAYGEAVNRLKVLVEGRLAELDEELTAPREGSGPPRRRRRRHPPRPPPPARQPPTR